MTSRAVDHFYAARDGNGISREPLRFDIWTIKADEIGPSVSAKVGSTKKQRANPKAIGILEAEHAERF